MAADKLQVLKKGKEIFDIYLREADLKALSKDKREQLLAGDHRESDERQSTPAIALAEEEEAIEDDGLGPDEQADLAASGDQTNAGKTQAKTKRRKKSSHLSRQPNKRVNPGSELSWIKNVPRNIKLLET